MILSQPRGVKIASGGVNNFRDFVLELKTLFLEVLNRRVVGRLDVGLHPMDRAVERVIFVRETSEMGVAGLQRDAIR